MAAPGSSLSFDTAFEPQTGTAVPVAPGVVRITAPNAGPFTFTGTNTYLVGTDSVAIVDPGPDDEAHLSAILAAVGGRSVVAIILTHTHRDHCALVPKLRGQIDAPLWFGGRHRPSRPKRVFELDWVARDSDYALVPDRELGDGERIEAGDVGLTVVATPGHCANHLSFGLAGTPFLLSGDHVMGWNSTMIAVPDGSMADYFASLERVIALPYAQYLPGHGGSIADGPGHAQRLLQHRQMRNEQVVEAVNGGARKMADLLAAIYPTLALNLRPAAAMTLKAHVEYLADAGAIRIRRRLLGTELAPAG